MMNPDKKIDEETALAVLFANLKGKKKKDYITTAKCCRYLRKQYGSLKKVADKVGISSEIIREFDSLLDLPKEVQQLISKRLIKLDTGYRISMRIEGAEKQTEIAKAVLDLGAFDARNVIEYARKNPKLSAEECKRRVLKSKTVTEKLHVFILPFPEETFQKLKATSKELKMAPENLVRKIVEEWLTKQCAH